MIVLRSDCCPCIGDGEGRNPCARKIRIDYVWSGCRDLDTYTEYDACGVGWDCYECDEGNPQWVTGDDTSTDGTESVEIEPKAFDSPDDVQYVYCSAKWYEGARSDEDADGGTNCPIAIRVTGCGKVLTKTVSTGAIGGGCASGNILAVVELYADGDFALL